MGRFWKASHFKSVGLTTVVSFSIVVFFSLVFVFHLPLRHWSDSEIWGVRQAAGCMADWHHYGCGLKPMFNFLFGNYHSLIGPKTLASEMSWMRLLGLIPTFLLAILLWVRAKKSLLVLISFVASSLFLIDLSVIRSDVASLGWVLLHAALLTDLKSKLKIRHRLAALVISFLIAVSLTPKMGLIFLCFLPLYYSELGPRRSLYFGSGFLVVALLAVPLLSFFSLPNAAQFFTASFDQRNLGVSYLSLASFQHLIRALKENPGLSLSLLTLIAAVIFDLKKNRSPLALSSVFILALLIFYPDKLPFLIGCLVLVFLYVSTESLKKIQVIRPRVETVLAVAAGVATIWGIHWTTVLRASNNSSQEKLAEKLSEILAPYPQARVVDSLGIIVDRPLVSVFLGPDSASARQQVIEKFKNRDYEIVIQTMKVLLVEPELMDSLTQNYIEASNGIYARSIDLNIQKSSQAAPEILAALESNFAKHLKPETPIAILTLNPEGTQWEYSALNVIPYSELQKKPKVCEKCQIIRVTPFGSLFGNALPAEFSKEFAFESRIPRPLPFAALFAQEEK